MRSGIEGLVASTVVGVAIVAMVGVWSIREAVQWHALVPEFAAVNETHLYWTAEKQQQYLVDRNHTWTASMGPFLYVMLDYDRVLVYPEDGSTHHSHMAQGLPVLAAGGLRRLSGGILVWDNVSGHYRPDPASLIHIGHWLSPTDRAHTHLRIWSKQRCTVDRCNIYFYESTPDRLEQLISPLWPTMLQFLAIRSATYSANFTVTQDTFTILYHLIPV
jgi:hypothetical protein